MKARVARMKGGRGGSPPTPSPDRGLRPGPLASPAWGSGPLRRLGAKRQPRPHRARLALSRARFQGSGTILDSALPGSILLYTFVDNLAFRAAGGTRLRNLGWSASQRT